MSVSLAQIASPEPVHIVNTLQNLIEELSFKIFTMQNVCPTCSLDHGIDNTQECRELEEKNKY